MEVNMHVSTKIPLVVSDVQAAELLGLKPQTLRNWRCQSRGPAYSKIGRRCIYAVQDLESYRAKNRIDPEADGGPAKV